MTTPLAEKLGRVRILVAGEKDLRDALLGRVEGGSKLEKGLATRLSERFGHRFAIEISADHCPPFETLLIALKNRSTEALPVVSKLRSQEFDVLVLSLGADLMTPGPEMGSGSSRAGHFLDVTTDLIRLIKRDFGCRIIVLNASTIDPAGHSSDLSRVPIEPSYITANRLNLALIKASLLEGISIIDADRLIAEMGAAEHVKEFLGYSEAACESLCEEMVRILSDYGFFDDRPLLLQVGSGGTS